MAAKTGSENVSSLKAISCRIHSPRVVTYSSTCRTRVPMVELAFLLLHQACIKWSTTRTISTKSKYNRTCPLCGSISRTMSMTTSSKLSICLRSWGLSRPRDSAVQFSMMSELGASTITSVNSSVKSQKYSNSRRRKSNPWLILSL